MRTKTRATIEDLNKVQGKAELVNGEIVYMPPTGDQPGYAGDEIFAALREYSKGIRKAGRLVIIKASGWIYRTASHSVQMRHSIRVRVLYAVL